MVARARTGEPKPARRGRRKHASRASPSNLRVSHSKRLDPGQVRRLFRAAGWEEDLARFPARQVKRLLRHSHYVLSAWEGKDLVALATAVSDGVLCALVQNLVVHPRYRRRGVGTWLLRELARATRRQHISCVYVLGMRGRRARAFFQRAGFRPLAWNIYLHLNH